MAGSSMDGLDLAFVTFHQSARRWEYQLEKCTIIPYPDAFLEQLKSSPNLYRDEQEKLSVDFGKWIAESINEFCKGLPKPDLLGVHGHTVIHRPHEQISWQLGDGRTIASMTRITTVTDFRTLDVELGGQGAPLVPYGDFHLFDEYDACLNLGGIANISIKEKAIAWDICPCNQVLNFFANKLGKPYDENGTLAKSGAFDRPFFEQISRLEYFTQEPPKSLPNNFISPTLLNEVIPEKGLHTYTAVIADQIANSLERASGSKLLITGGGAFNSYLIDCIRSKLDDWTVIVPIAELVEFKESLVFAFLALIRLRNEINTLSSVTGATKDSSSGVIHRPND